MALEARDYLIEDPTAQRIHKKTRVVTAWFSKRNPERPADLEPFGDRWRVLFDYIRVWELAGRAAGKYVKWELVLPEDQDTTQKKIIQTNFWARLGLDKDAFAFWVANQDMLDQSLRSVFVEEQRGRPLGEYMGLISRDPRRLRGLFVVLYGHRNTAPCEQCENRYLSTTQDPLDCPDNRVIHIMWPFMSCVSLPGYGCGACGNCLYHPGSGICTYAQYADHPKVKPLRAKRKNSTNGMDTLGPRPDFPSVIRWTYSEQEIKVFKELQDKGDLQHF